MELPQTVSGSGGGQSQGSDQPLRDRELVRSRVECLVAALLVASCSTTAHKVYTPTDPDSPAALTAQLNEAERLLSADEGPCNERLIRAQEQLGSVDASPRTRVLYPGGWATVADLEYRIHLARAACDGAAHRQEELRMAVSAARRAVELYRNLFDYHSMVVLQFDASVALHDLGDDTAAIDSLGTALKMDREFGFMEDARENYALWLTWRGQPAGDTQVAALMRDFPMRQAALKFGWGPRDARITLQSDRACLLDGQVISSRASAAFERQIRPNDAGGWSVSYTRRLTGYDPGVWPTFQGSPPMAFPPVLIPETSFEVSASGEFNLVTEPKEFAEQLAAKTEELIRTSAPSGESARDIMEVAIDRMPDELSAGLLEAATAENYQSETAMWIGATLDQGVWYEVSAPLSLPGLPRVVTQHRIEFAFTRMVPCSADADKATCVEIITRATPEQEALDRLLADYNSRPAPGHIDSYTASTTTRIVADPATLLPYAHQKRVFWYASAGKGNTVFRSENTVSTSQYGASRLTSPPRAGSE
jgi:hypothetical protein